MSVLPSFRRKPESSYSDMLCSGCRIRSGMTIWSFLYWHRSETIINSILMFFISLRSSFWNDEWWMMKFTLVAIFFSQSHFCTAARITHPSNTICAPYLRPLANTHFHHSSLYPVSIPSVIMPVGAKNFSPVHVAIFIKILVPVLHHCPFSIARYPLFNPFSDQVKFPGGSLGKMEFQ